MRFAASTLLWLLACNPPGAALPVERLEAPAELLIADVVSDVATQRAFTLTNEGAGGARVRLSVTPPFFLPNRDVFIPAGASVTLRVGIEAPGYAPIDGGLHIAGPFDRSTEVALRATFDLDVDGDGFVAVEAGGDDCDDADARVHPGAPERCDGLDNDCNGLVDDDPVDAPTWYRDADNDTWGRDDETLAQCAPPVGHVARGGDCDDGDPTIHPAATEIWYDGVDQDCDGASDFDQDRDGHDHWLHGGGDCWDTNRNVHPGAPERDNLIDDDCDGLVDEDFLVAGDLLFTEILQAPRAHIPEHGQFVEIYNATAARTLDLVSMRVATDAGDVVLPARRLAPGEVVLLCGHLAPTWNGGLTCLARLPGLLAEDDAISITSAAPLDVVDWTGWAWPEGASLQLGVLDEAANDDPTSWCPATTPWRDGDLGSPGSIPACE